MHSKKIPIVLILITILSNTVYSQNKNVNVQSTNFVHSNKIDKNNIEMHFNNWGESYTPDTQSGGFWNVPNEPHSRGIVYDQGPWIIGKRNNEIVISGAQWYYGYSPGPIINGQAAMLIHPEDSTKYRVYKINKGDNNSNPDYAEWPVNFGAPINNQGEPLVLGAQTLWTSFNYLDSNLVYPFGFPQNKISPLEIEIHQSVFAREGNEIDLQNIFANVTFIEYEIIYKGLDPIDSAYFGFWTDIDFDPWNDNRPAVNVPLDLGYCWTDKDTMFDGTIPVSVGYAMLYGPVIPFAGSNAVFKGKSKSNYKNLNISSFKGIADDGTFPSDSLYAPISSIMDALNYSRGLNRNGNPYIDPITLQPTTFPFSGDPVTGTGWLYDGFTGGGGAGFMFFSGPFTLATNDTQWTMIALVPGLGNTNLNSIQAMREKVEILRSLPYDSIAFGSTNYFITDVEEKYNSIPEKFSLTQNYPNPFNPSTKISWQSPVSGHHSLKIYDVLGSEVATLVNQEQNAGNYNVDFNAKHLSSGVYFYQLKSGEFIQTKKMVLLK